MKRQKTYQELAAIAQGRAIRVSIHCPDEVVAKRLNIPWNVQNARGLKSQVYFYTSASR